MQNRHVRSVPLVKCFISIFFFNALCTLSEIKLCIISDLNSETDIKYEHSKKCIQCMFFCLSIYGYTILGKKIKGSNFYPAISETFLTVCKLLDFYL